MAVVQCFSGTGTGSLRWCGVGGRAALRSTLWGTSAQCECWQGRGGGHWKHHSVLGSARRRAPQLGVQRIAGAGPLGEGSGRRRGRLREGHAHMVAVDVMACGPGRVARSGLAPEARFGSDGVASAPTGGSWCAYTSQMHLPVHGRRCRHAMIFCRAAAAARL